MNLVWFLILFDDYRSPFKVFCCNQNGHFFSDPVILCGLFFIGDFVLLS
jgi:hypothetical protein